MIRHCIVATAFCICLTVGAGASKGVTACARQTSQDPETKAVQQATGQDKPAVVIKRRDELTDEELRKQLALVQEVGLNQSAAAALYAQLQQGLKNGKRGVQNPVQLAPDLGAKLFASLVVETGRPELTLLPWRAGTDSQLGKEPAENLHMLSLQLRAMLRNAVPEGDVRVNAGALREAFENVDSKDWTKPEAVGALTQLLQVENTAVRMLLVDRLALIEGKQAGEALAQRALFDLSPAVREKAVASLAKRPANEYKMALLEGFRWPWPAAADHAAEAVVALKRDHLAAGLVNLLKEPDPMLPFARQGKGKETYYIREAVRVNHMCNCMLCHAPSLAKEDLIRGRVPTPGEDPPPLYNQQGDGLFVRAEFTFLRQDFSLVQPVVAPGNWPGQQRYDYMVRTRPLANFELKAFLKQQKEMKLPTSYPQRDSVLYTLRELTQQDAGTGYDEWSKMLKTFIEKKAESKDKR